MRRKCGVRIKYPGIPSQPAPKGSVRPGARAPVLKFFRWARWRKVSISAPLTAKAHPLYKLRSQPFRWDGKLGVWRDKPCRSTASLRSSDRNSSKPRFEELLVEAVGIEPTSEELQSPVSPCAAGCYISPGGRSAGGLPRGPARKISVTVYGRHGGPAHLTSSIPDRRAEPREGRGYLSSQCVVVIGS